MRVALRLLLCIGVGIALVVGAFGAVEARQRRDRVRVYRCVLDSNAVAHTLEVHNPTAETVTADFYGYQPSGTKVTFADFNLGPFETESRLVGTTDGGLELRTRGKLLVDGSARDTQSTAGTEDDHYRQIRCT